MALLVFESAYSPAKAVPAAKSATSAPGIEAIQFRVIHIAANGPIVMTERVDVFKLPNKSSELPVMGIFEVSEGKIRAWRDYFDMNQFASRMG